MSSPKPESRPIREDDQIIIAHGRGSGAAARGVASILDLPIVDLEQKEYSDRQAYARIDRENGKNNLRDLTVIYFSSVPAIGGISPSDALVDSALAADLFLKRAHVKAFNEVVLYQTFATEDRTKGEVRALSLKVAADIMTLNPPNKLLIVEPHTEYLELAFSGPVSPQFLWTTNFMAANVAHAFRQIDVPQNKVRALGPDHGSKVRTSQFTNIMRTRYSFLMNPHYGLAEKERISSESTRLMGISGRGALKWAWLPLPDDMIRRGTTLADPAAAAKKRGASAVLGLVTHGVITRDKKGVPQILAELNLYRLPPVGSCAQLGEQVF